MPNVERVDREQQGTHSTREWDHRMKLVSSSAVLQEAVIAIGLDDFTRRLDKFTEEERSLALSHVD